LTFAFAIANILNRLDGLILSGQLWVCRQKYDTVFAILLAEPSTTTMGIRGLLQLLKQKVPKSRFAPDFSKKDARWGIDCSCLMFKARGAGLDVLTVLAALIVRLRSYGINPVVVFDGYMGAVTAKAEVLETRRQERQTVAAALEAVRETALAATTVQEREDCNTAEAALLKKAPQINRSDRDALKQFFHMAGIQFFTAKGEADTLLSAMARSGYIQAVITSDTDMLARGISRVIMPEVADATVLTEWRLDAVLQGLRLTYDEFVRMCVWMGTDYNSTGTVPGVRALEMVREGKTLTAASDAAAAAEQLQSVGAPEEYLEGKQLDRWRSDPSKVEPDELRDLFKIKGWPVSWLLTLMSEEK
jgi:exonuclease-1